MSSNSCWTSRLAGPRLIRALLLCCALAAGAEAQPDTKATEPRLVFADTTATSAVSDAPPRPSAALWRSLVLPGWGQAYNRDWLKVPVVTGGVGAAVAFVVVLNTRAVRYRRAAIYADCVVTPVEVPEGGCDGASDFEAAWIEAGSLSAVQNRALRDSNRRNRDLLILLGTLAYGLQALDAYVSAELADFDVGEDLSLRVVPTLNGPVASLRWTF